MVDMDFTELLSLMDIILALTAGIFIGFFISGFMLLRFILKIWRSIKRASAEDLNNATK